ncbi:hypothetical protein Godav_023895 [Gossypium davidsonii]|uniref:Endonuclease/exonuclease/phosphatase domain-containing protein n=1 Tax=Gossypium davidsonii TaxID=34287 RepID=A0A7J8SU07_GOSDV|nr:hypothetical protein [Gossypium davidsonii]
MRHRVKECTCISVAEREKKDDEYPYSMALKAESNLIGKESLQFGFSTKRIMKQCFYTGANAVEMEDVLSKKPLEFDHQKEEQIRLKVTIEDLATTEVVIDKCKNCMENIEVFDKSNYDENDNKKPRVEMNDLDASRPGAMKLLSWNVCRLGNPRAIRRLQHLLKKHYPQIVFFMETKLNCQRMERYYRYDFQNGIVYRLKELGGGIPKEERRMEDFCSTLKNCYLVHMGFTIWVSRKKILEASSRNISKPLFFLLEGVSSWEQKIKTKRKGLVDGLTKELEALNKQESGGQSHEVNRGKITAQHED